MTSRSTCMRGSILGLICGLAMVAAACSGESQSVSAEANEATLAGVVTSDKEGPMEGVLVSAKLGTVTTTVVTDKSGRYAFPAGRLAPGRYDMRIRAIGYDLPQTETVEIGGATTKDLKLVETRDLAKQ